MFHKVKEWRWDVITGHSSLSAVEVSIPMKWPFCTLLFCGWDPTLGDALDFHPFPTEAPDTFRTPERDQLPAAPCQMTSGSCGYRTAAAFRTPLSVSWEKTRNCLKTFFSSLVVAAHHLLLPCFFSPVRAYFVLYCASVYVWIWVTFNESLVPSLCVALWASVFVSFLQKEQKIDFLSISGVTTIVIFGCNQTNFSVAWCFQCLSWYFFFFVKFAICVLCRCFLLFSTLLSLMLFAFIVLCSLSCSLFSRCSNHTSIIARVNKTKSVIRINIFKKGQAHNRPRDVYRHMQHGSPLA